LKEQRIKEEEKENIEYRILNIELRTNITTKITKGKKKNYLNRRNFGKAG
jgi:hypothetical protein